MPSLEQQQQAFDQTAPSAYRVLLTYMERNEARIINLARKRAFSEGVEVYGEAGEKAGRSWLVETEAELADAVYYIHRFIVEPVPMELTDRYSDDDFGPDWKSELAEDES